MTAGSGCSPDVPKTASELANTTTGPVPSARQDASSDSVARRLARMPRSKSASHSPLTAAARWKITSAPASGPGGRGGSSNSPRSPWMTVTRASAARSGGTGTRSMSVIPDRARGPAPATSTEPAASSSRASREPRKPPPPVITTLTTAPPSTIIGLAFAEGQRSPKDRGFCRGQGSGQPRRAGVPPDPRAGHPGRRCRRGGRAGRPQRGRARRPGRDPGRASRGGAAARHDLRPPGHGARLASAPLDSGPRRRSLATAPACQDGGVDVLSSRILLRPADLDRSQHFYRDVLGLAVYREFGPPAAPGLVFFLGPGLLEVAGSADPGAPESGLMLWLQVRDVHAEH